MLRSLVFVVVLAALAAAAVWFADHPGDVSIRWAGYAISTSVGVLIVTVAAIAVLWALIYHFWRWLRGGPRRLREGRAARRREEGYRALTKGLVAVAAGDPKAAQRLGRKAGKLVENPLNLLLLAQAAQLDGDEAAARRHFGAMLEHPETEFLGLRGLIVQASRDGDWQTARRYARRAYALRPDAEWVNTALFDLEVRAGDWWAAQRTLESIANNKILDGDAVKRRRGLIFAERARAALADDQPDDALVLAREAHRLAPELVAPAATAAEILAAKGKRRAATKLVEEAWERAPHPDLARAFAAIAPDETALARFKRLETLHARNPDDPESHLALAEAALEAELWGAARRHLEAAAAARPTQRTYRLLATVEERDGDPQSVRAWLLRAAGAPPDPVWLCGECGGLSAEWRASCPACGAFDALAWKTPPARTMIEPPGEPEPPPGETAPTSLPAAERGEAGVDAAGARE